MRKKTIGWAAAVLLVLAVGATAVIVGASDQEQALTESDSAAMRALVDDYWEAKQGAWPEAERGNQRLSAQASEQLRAKRRKALKLTTGNIKDWEADFDPAGFLEESRKEGVITIATGYKIVDFADPTLVSEGTAEADVTVWSWGEEVVVDDAGEPAGKPVTPDSTVVYRYTFEKVDGVWKLSNEDLKTSPLDPDEDAFGPRKPEGEI